MLVTCPATPFMRSLASQLIINPILAHSRKKAEGKETPFFFPTPFLSPNGDFSAPWLNKPEINAKISLSLYFLGCAL